MPSMCEARRSLSSQESRDSALARVNKNKFRRLCEKAARPSGTEAWRTPRRQEEPINRNKHMVGNRPGLKYSQREMLVQTTRESCRVLRGTVFAQISGVNCCAWVRLRSLSTSASKEESKTRQRCTNNEHRLRQRGCLSAAVVQSTSSFDGGVFNGKVARKPNTAYGGDGGKIEPQSLHSAGAGERPRWRLRGRSPSDTGCQTRWIRAE